MQLSHPTLSHTAHRPWPLPAGKWAMKQTWKNLLFLHWPVEPSAIREQIPKDLEIDSYDGMAWIGVIPFDMKGVTKRGFPAPSLFCDFPEINVRTYVVRDGRPGVWFFSLDITNLPAVWVARTFFHLPYFPAKIRVEEEGEKVHYHERRKDRMFDGTYWPVGKKAYAADSFERWSTERYCLYTTNRKGTLFRGEIHHPQWPLEEAEVDLRVNTLVDPFPVGERHPSILFSRSIDVVVWPLTRIVQQI